VAGLGASRLSRWFAAGVVVSGIAVLGTVTVHTTSASTLAAQAVQRSADQADERLFDCLSDRAHQLVSPSEPVHIRGEGLEQVIYLEGSIAAWASLTPGDRPAPVTLDIASGSGPGSCGGFVLTAEHTGRP
jgi:hypothetical protein